MSETNEHDQILTLTYNLYDLPTAQHKAGLAGLILMIESMKARKLSPIPEVEFGGPSKAIISFTKDSIRTLFDDLYDAEWIEIETRSKWKGKLPKREITREVDRPGDKKSEVKYFIYDQFIPKGEFLKSLLPDDGDLWLKLWRDMLWETLRGIPTTRGVFRDRADGKTSSLAQETWDSLNKSAIIKAKGSMLIEPIVSSTFIGAQDRNAENVPFQGNVEQNFLLHFWTIASLIFIPRFIKKSDKTREYGFEEMGYVLAVPEPSNLESFITDAYDLLKKLDTEKQGYRPRSALICLPAESGLEYFCRLARAHVCEKEIACSLAAVEIYHLEKRGNTIAALASERISPDGQIIKGYDTLSRKCHNPLFRSQRINNLLSQKPWHASMENIFDQYPWEFFIFNQGKTPDSKKIPFFGLDISVMFQDILSNLDSLKGGAIMSQEIQDDRLSGCVYRLMMGYVNRRTEEKAGAKYNEFKNNKDDKGRVIYPPEYREAREKVCSDAFLAMRGRREQDFIEYFTGTICSVAQYLPEEDYLLVSRDLINSPDTVKTLSMLALSANSNMNH